MEQQNWPEGQVFQTEIGSAGGSWITAWLGGADPYLRRRRPSGMIASMIIGDRLRALREEKKLSQGDIEKRTGLIRCYISRVENGHTVPSIETLEKFARALEVPLYQLFYDGEDLPNLPKPRTATESAWGSSGKDARTLSKFRRLIGRMEGGDRRLLSQVAQKMAIESTPKLRGLAR